MLCKIIYLSFLYKIFSLDKIIKQIKKSKTKQKFLKNEINPEFLILFPRKVIKHLFNTHDCLFRSFVSIILLKESGFKPTFKIGINFDDKLDSHSWIEINNRPLFEENISKYNVIKTIK